jgi:DNA polymerase III epsilon subunit-like protein
MRNLFFDTETTGLPAKGLNWSTDFDKFPHIVSIAWKIGKEAKEFKIYQEGRVIPKEVTAIHGITTEQGNDPNTTYPIKKVLEQFMYDGERADKMIGFNTYFDSSIIKASVLRTFGTESIEAELIKKILDKDRRVDVMRMAIPLFSGKWPKLTELHLKLFDKSFPAHSAGSDVEALERCYEALVRGQAMARVLKSAEEDKLI